MEHHYLPSALKEFVKRIKLTVVGIEILVGREEFEPPDPMALNIRHHDLCDIRVVRIDGAEGNQFRVAFAKVEHEIIGNTARYCGVVCDADSVINALVLEKLNELFGSHESVHQLHKGRAQ